MRREVTLAISDLGSIGEFLGAIAVLVNLRGQDQVASRRASITAKIKPAIMLLVLLVCAGCTQINHRGYEAFVRDLDAQNQLQITTYPADLPSRLTESDETFQSLESANQVYFQVFIRDPSKSIGSNENVESIFIHSFYYKLGDQPRVRLLTDYPDNFWMHGSPRYDKQGHKPIPYLPDGSISIEISFTLNGQYLEFSGEMKAVENTSIWPTLIVEQGV